MGSHKKRISQKKLLGTLTVLLVLSAALFGVMLSYTLRVQRRSRAEAAALQAYTTAPAGAFTEASTEAPAEPPTDPAEESTAETVPETKPETTAETVPETIPETEAPTEPPEPLPEYAEFHEKNPDFFGWLKIEGTRIDYPVMYTPQDPEKYLHANENGRYSFAGTPFMDAGCTADSTNQIIYAHNMLDGSMFRSLLKYQQKDYWQRHPVITFDTLYEKREYEVLAAFYDRVYYQYEDCFKFYNFIDPTDEADFQNAMDNYRSKSLYDTEVEASYGDRLVTLVTCAYHTQNGRFVVVARQKQ